MSAGHCLPCKSLCVQTLQGTGGCFPYVPAQYALGLERRRAGRADNVVMALWWQRGTWNQENQTKECYHTLGVYKGLDLGT